MDATNVNENEVGFTLDEVRDLAKNMRVMDHPLFRRVMINSGGLISQALIKELGEEKGNVLYCIEEGTFEVGRFRGIRTDVSLKCENGFISIDLQNNSEKDLEDRIFHYGLVESVALVESGEDYSKRRGKSVTVIFLCEFDLFDQGKDVYTETVKCFGIDEIRIIVINLNVARKRNDGLGMFARDMARKDPLEMESDDMRRIVSTVKTNYGDLIIMTKEINDSFKEKFKVLGAKIRAEGRAEGKAEGVREVAASLVQAGLLKDSEIADATKMSTSEIKEIRENLAHQATIMT